MFGGDSEVRTKDNFLMDGIDAVVDRLMRGRQGDRLSLPVDFAAGAFMHPREHLDERGFTRAILPDDRVDLPGLKLQINRFERMGRSKALVQLLENEQGLALPCGRATLLRLIHRRPRLSRS